VYSKRFNVNATPKISKIQIYLNLGYKRFNTGYVGKISSFLKNITNQKATTLKSKKNIAYLSLRSGFICEVGVNMFNQQDVYYFIDNFVNL
jgi:ribosomal protein L5